MTKRSTKQNIADITSQYIAESLPQDPNTESLSDEFDPSLETSTDAEPETKACATAWREVTISRSFDVKFNHEQIHQLANELVEVIREVSALESEKKASAGEFKSKIDAALIRQTEITEKIESGGTVMEVDCQWLFQCSGMDEKGMEIFHPEYKTLIRLDTREAVQSVKMNESDFEHQELALNVDKQPEHNIEPTGPVTTGDDDDVIYDD